MIIEFDALLQFSFQEMDAKYLVVLLAGIFFTCQAQYSNPTAVKDVAKTTGSVSKAPKMEMFKCSETQLKDSDAGQKSALCHGRWPEDQSLTPEVTDLTVHGTGTKIITSATLKFIPAQIITLRITACSIEKIEAGTFSALTIINEIDLSNNALKTVEKSTFSRNLRLRRIKLQRNQIATIERGCFASLANLDILDLSQNQLTDVPADLPPTLTELYLADNKIIQLSNSIQLPNLLLLNLCGNMINFITKESIACPKLNNFCLGSRELKAGTTVFSGLTELEVLTLSGKTSTMAVLRDDVLEGIAGCKKLKKLVIDHYTLTSLSTVMVSLVDLEKLALNFVNVNHPPLGGDFAGMSKLTWLDLTGSVSVADDILYNIEIRRALLRLETLLLRDCEIIDMKWFPLPNVQLPTQVTPMPSLTQLDISNNPIYCNDQETKQVLCHLEGSFVAAPSLRIVNVQNTVEIMNIDDTTCLMENHQPQQVRDMNFSDCPTAPTPWAPSLPTTTTTPDVTGPLPQPEGRGSSSNVWWIVLIVLLCILTIVAVTLCVVCRKSKRKGMEKIPGDSCPEKAETAGVTSYTKLSKKATSEDTLLSKK